MAARSEGRSLLMVQASFAQPARAYSVQGWSNQSDCHAGLKQKRVLSRGVSRVLISEFQGIGFTCRLPTSASLTSDLFNSPARRRTAALVLVADSRRTSREVRKN